MLPYFTETFANPSSAHEPGKEAAEALSVARGRVQALIGAARPDEIVFTSGATEANTTALLQALGRGGRDELIISAVEHPAVLQTAAELEKNHGIAVHRIGVDGRGRLDLAAYGRALSRRTALVSIMWANNETGVAFAVAELAEMAHAAGALFHTDAVQAAGKTFINVAATKIDLLSLSAHKFHGPKGAGALYVRQGANFRALLRGGRQERSRRAGTENVPAIVGLGKAAELARLRCHDDGLRIAMLRDWLERSVLSLVPASTVLGADETRLANTSMIAFDGADSEEVLHRLNRVGIAASAGSACGAGIVQPSHVLRAMRVPYTAAQGALRFSLSRETTEAEINLVLQVLPGIIAESRATSSFAPRTAVS